MEVALVHDYLTQRGGAERVVVELLRTFPGAPLYTSLYSPSSTFPDFAAADVRPLMLNGLGVLRRHHRLALPLLAPAFSRLRVEANVVVCSSSGWAHGARTGGRKVVYCYTPARWLYQPRRYLGARAPGRRAALTVLGPTLRRWDRRAAQSADRYLTSSTVVRDRIRETYGIDAEILPLPPALLPGPDEPVAGIDPGFFLCVARLLPYKNVDAVVEAFARLSDERLVVVGDGPDAKRLEAAAPTNTTFLARPTDAQLRWLYAASVGLVAASWEDYGLTPLEAAAFGRPTAALRAGGYLDTTVEGETGLFFDEPRPDAIAATVRAVANATWDKRALTAHAARFSAARFARRLREVVGEERSR